MSHWTRLDLSPSITYVVLGAGPCSIRAPSRGQLLRRERPAPSGLGSPALAPAQQPLPPTLGASQRRQLPVPLPHDSLPRPSEGVHQAKGNLFYLSGFLLPSPRTVAVMHAWGSAAPRWSGWSLLESPCCYRAMLGCLLARSSAHAAKPVANPWTCPPCPGWPRPRACAEGGCEATALPQCPGSTACPCPGREQGLIWGPGASSHPGT